MFENLTGKLQQVFRKIGGYGTITESNISEAMEEIQGALVDADVNYNVVKEFTEQVRKECLGADVLRTVTPGQQFVKIVYDKLVELMGAEAAPLKLDGKPAVIMMIGLHGSGKTTTCAKIALNLKKQGRRVLLVAGDIYRPAAIDQLEVLGGEIDVRVYSDRSSTDVPSIARGALDFASKNMCDTLIIDTAGRLQIDGQMVMELVSVKQTVQPQEILLVADAALGQEAVSVADHFHKALDITGIVLTKLDGDARGGSALSMRKVTDCPIKFVGVGEKMADLETFHPERMASRILGMGDIVSLVEKAAEEIDREEAAKLEEKIRSKSFDFNDFMVQLQQMKKMGGIESVLKMLPGGDSLLAQQGFDGDKLIHMEAIISSMTKTEREKPEIIDFSRRKRISKGSGTTLQEVGDLIKQFAMMRKLLRQTSLVNKLMSGIALPGLGAMGGPRLHRGTNMMRPKKRRR